jgi:hypothetical protein
MKLVKKQAQPSGANAQNSGGALLGRTVGRRRGRRDDVVDAHDASRGRGVG